MDFNIKLLIGIVVVSLVVVIYRRIRYGAFKEWPTQVKNYTLNSLVYSLGWVIFLIIRVVVGSLPGWQYWALVIVLLAYFYFAVKLIDKKYPR
jgi:hypothetical protein